MRNIAQKVVIIGGSLAGLMNAIVFRNLGYTVHILERSEPSALQSEAAGIRGRPEVHEFFEKYVSGYDSGYAIMTKMVEIMDGNRNIVQKIPPKDPMRLTTWKAVYNMLKAELLSTTGETPVVTYQTSHEVRDATEKGEKLLVKVSNLGTNGNSVLEAELVIAANGAHSAIRKKISICWIRLVA